MAADPTATPPRVGVYALIGQGDRLLVVKHLDHTVLPGGAVRSGDPVEQVLRTTLHDQLGADVAALDVCAVVEHGTGTPGLPPASELAFLFDMTLTDPEVCSAPHHHWAAEHELASLRPAAIKNVLIAGRVSADNPWKAWTP